MDKDSKRSVCDKRANKEKAAGHVLNSLDGFLRPVCGLIQSDVVCNTYSIRLGVINNLRRRLHQLHQRRQLQM